MPPPVVRKWGSLDLDAVVSERGSVSSSVVKPVLVVPHFSAELFPGPGSVVCSQ